MALTEYERKRIDNIKRNGELLASLNIKSKLAELSSSKKRHRLETKSYPEKKPKSETPIVIRRSLRSQGKAPDSKGLYKYFTQPSNKSIALKSKTSPKQAISMRDANTCLESDETLVNKILSVRKVKDGDRKLRASVDLESMELAPENIASLVSSKIVSLKFFPSPDLKMVVVGNKFGTLGFWTVDSENEDNDGDGIYLYRPHFAPVSAILIHPFSLNKIVTSCYGGSVRSLDVKKQTFGLVYSSEHPVFTMSQHPDDVNSLYLGEGHGVVSVWDVRSARSSLSWDLHSSRINTIDFNSENTNMMATSSSDGTACIWDLRTLGENKPKCLKVIACERAVHSAYFSPSGGLLATTSIDDKMRVLSGANYEDELVINHHNQTGRWLSSSKGVWGWDDSYIFVGNMKKRVDVISTEQRRLVTTLESPHLNAPPCCLDTHPFIPGMLAGATGGGKVYIWT